MAGKLTRLTHRMAIQLHLVAESCTICSSHCRQPSWRTFGYTLILLQSYSQSGVLSQTPDI